MIVDLDKLRGNEDVLSGREVIEFRDFRGEESRINCLIRLNVTKRGRMYYMKADLKGDLGAFCHRCLGPVDCVIDAFFDLIVQRGGTDKIAAEDKYEYVHLGMNEHEVCLDSQIYESLIVNIPMQILCAEDCRGLCPECGINLNSEKCSCSNETDSRWEDLKKLKDKLPRSNAE